MVSEASRPSRVSCLYVACVRTRRIEDRLLDLDVLQDSIQRVEGELGHHLEKRDEEINGIAKNFAGLQEWKSRVSAVSYEARHLFESEPVRELMDNLGSRHNALTAEPPR